MSPSRPTRPTRSIVTSIVVFTLLASTIAPLLGGVPVAAQQSGVPGTEANGTEIVVRQNGQCYPIQAFGNETRSIETFYDYRSPGSTPSGWYRAYGELQGLLRQDTSQVLLYNGSEGLSLVFVHDGLANESGSGGTVAMNVTGLPAGGNWTIQDDDYADRDDVFELRNTSAHIEWYWNNGNRSDGAAFLGLGSENWEEIRIDPAFNEASPQYPYEKWDGPPESNEITTWIARSANGTSYELDMDGPITVARGPCDTEAPSAALAVSSRTLVSGTEVTLNASGSTDSEGILEYRWDHNGDGTIETVTDDPTLRTTFDRSGTYNPRVTVVDRANNTANASVSLQVEVETTTAVTTERTTTDSDVGSEPMSDGSPLDAASASSAIDGPSLLGLVVLTLALCGLAVAVVRR